MCDTLYLEDIVIQLFTSGSTGTPKAIGHTNAGMTAYMYDYMKESRWEPEDIYQTSANLFHLSGLSVLTSLMVGSTTVFFARFDLIEFLSWNGKRPPGSVLCRLW